MITIFLLEDNCMELLRELRQLLESDTQVSDATRKAVYHADYLKRRKKKKSKSPKEV